MFTYLKLWFTYLISRHRSTYIFMFDIYCVQCWSLDVSGITTYWYFLIFTFNTDVRLWFSSIEFIQAVVNQWLSSLVEWHTTNNHKLTNCLVLKCRKTPINQSMNHVVNEKFGLLSCITIASGMKIVTGIISWHKSVEVSWLFNSLRLR